MSDQLPPIPVDNAALELIKHALGGSYTFDDDDHLTLIGADFTLDQLLKFWSGYDPADSMLLEPGDDRIFGVAGAAIYEHTKPLYSERDLLAALLDEVVRLRAQPR